MKTKYARTIRGGIRNAKTLKGYEPYNRIQAAHIYAGILYGYPDHCGTFGWLAARAMIEYTERQILKTPIKGSN